MNKIYNNNNCLNPIEISKFDLNVFTKMNIEVVSFDYKPKLGENVFLAYILGDIPIMLKSKTMTKEEFYRTIS